MDGSSVEASGQLVDECRRLVDRLTSVNVGWFAARLGDGLSTREERLHALVRVLADLGREAGTGAPAGASPRDVGVHALADQVTVLVHDILRAPDGARLAGIATAAATSCYDELWALLTP
jgi:hypothetical protein